MRWVPVAANRPQRCAAIPFVSSHHPKGFIDTGAILPGWDPHVYVSVVAVEEMARMIGWGPAVKPADEQSVSKEPRKPGRPRKVA